MTATTCDDLDAELDRWRDAGAAATLWLRDDDAIDATPDLERLLGLAEAAGAPLALAVIPALAKPTLAAKLAGWGNVSVLQHGYSHANHAPAGVKKSEYNDARSTGEMTGEILRGRATLLRMFGEATQPVLAPPWNRMTTRLAPCLKACGLAGLSRFKPRARPEAAPGVAEANTHVDLIDWRADRAGKSCAAVAAEVAAHLRARRTGAVDPAEPTGILSHHLVMDATAWSALAGLLGRYGADRRVTWLGAPAVFAHSPAGSTR